MSRRARQLGWWIAGVGAALVIVATLRPQPVTGARTQLDPSAAADRLANVILFLPIGVGLAMARVARWRAVLSGVLLSALVEILQHWIPGRYPNPLDVVTNGLGTALGGALLPWLAAPPSRRVAGAALALVLAGLVGLAWLAEPAVLPGPYAVRLRPPNSRGRWLGAVHRLTVGPLRVPAGQRSEPLSQLFKDGAPLRMSLTVKERPDRGRHIAQILGAEGRTVLRVGQYRDGLRLTVGDRGTHLGFGHTPLRWQGALVPGHHRISLRPGHDGLCVGFDGEVRCGLGPSIAHGWARIHTLNGTAPWVPTLLDVLWMLGIGALVGAWAPSLRWVTGATAFAVGVSVYLVTGTGLAAPPAWGVVLGVGAAFIARILRHHLDPRVPAPAQPEAPSGALAAPRLATPPPASPARPAS